jgi:hypothetical protein
MQDPSVYELANDLYIYFINYLDIKDKCIVKKEDYSESTDLGREIYEIIEEEIIRNIMQPFTNDWKLLGEGDIKKRIMISWIELTSDGKMDIYCEDSVSIHTEADFNFRAERDFNLEVGRNINVKAGKNINLESTEDFNLKVDRSGRLHFAESANIKSDTELRLSGDSAVHLKGDAVYQSAKGNFNITGSTNFFTASGDTNISSGGMHFETAAKVHMNGPSAGTASPATDPSTPGKMITYSLPGTDKNVGWSDGNFYKGSPISSIMQRVPMHEPWVQHENIDVTKFSKPATDVTIGSDTTVISANRPG